MSTKKVVGILQALKNKNESNTIKYGTSNIWACESDGANIKKNTHIILCHQHLH
jgi:hypothetical protein